MMPLRVIQNERELYEDYNNILREQSKLAISIDGASDRDQIAIENGLQEFFTAEVIKLAHDDLRISGIPEEFLDESRLRSSLEGLPLPERDLRILEAKVRQLAMRMRQIQDGGDGGIDPGDGDDGSKGPPSNQSATGTTQQASHTAGHVCICMTNQAPGTTISLSSFNPLPAPPLGQNFITIAVLLQVHNVWGMTFSGDMLGLQVDPGSPFGIASDEMQVGLASKVNWAKEIYAWSLCYGKLASVYQSGPNATPNYMTLKKGGCTGANTIVFRKPQFGGYWADVSNYDFTLFWTVFGGRRLTFTWIAD